MTAGGREKLPEGQGTLLGDREAEAVRKARALAADLLARLPGVLRELDEALATIERGEEVKR